MGTLRLFPECPESVPEGERTENRKSEIQMGTGPDRSLPETATAQGRQISADHSDAALAGRLLFAGVQRDLPEKNTAGDREELFRPQEYLCRN